VPILPIDLQTLFTQSGQVGKEQSVQKDAPPAAQSLQGSQLVQKAAQADASVNETHAQEEEGPEQVKDRARRGAERRKRQGRGPRKPPEIPPAAPASFRDPALGRNVDISG
jgi:hypothetical protein